MDVTIKKELKKSVESTYKKVFTLDVDILSIGYEGTKMKNGVVDDSLKVARRHIGPKEYRGEAIVYDPEEWESHTIECQTGNRFTKAIVFKRKVNVQKKPKRTKK